MTSDDSHIINVVEDKRDLLRASMKYGIVMQKIINEYVDRIEDLEVRLQRLEELLGE